MIATARSRFALILATLAVVALAGCTSTDSDPVSSPPATGTPTATATPTAAAAAASVILGSQVADVVAADSTVIGRIDFFGSTADAVEILTAAFGAAPTVVDYPMGIESPAGTSYDWGGFELRDPEPAGLAPEQPEFVVLVTVASVGDVVVAGPGGVRVGDDVAALTSKWAAEPAVRIGDGTFHFDIVEVGAASSATEAPHELSVFAYAAQASSTITQISTPAQNWGV